MGAGNSGAETNVVEGYRLGPAGEIFMPMDAEARRQIEDLRQRIESLEARPKIWQGTAAEHAEAFEKGEVRVGDFVIISNDPDGGTAGGDDGEGTDTEPGAGTGDAGAGAVQDGGMPDTEPDDGQQSLREDVEK